MPKRLVLIVLLLLVLFGGVFGWKFYAGKKMAAMMSAPPPPAVIASTRVRRDTWQPTLSAVGSLVANKGVTVANEIAGVVRSIGFSSGQQVSRGDLLVQLDDDVDRAELASLIAARRLAEITFKRMKKLVREKTVSQSDYDEARATLDGATALVTSKRASIAKKAVRAPFSGVLGIRQVDIGQYLKPGSGIVSLQTLNPMYVDFSLPEKQLASVHTGQPVTVSVRAYPEKTFSGQISAVSPGISTTTRSVRLRALLENPQQMLRPGMFAKVQTHLASRSGVLSLPERAIAYNPYGNTVFLISEKDGSLFVQNRQVQTGEVRAGRIEIISGLTEGDRVVSDGLNKLRNGQSVRIDNTVRLEAAPREP